MFLAVSSKQTSPLSPISARTVLRTHSYRFHLSRATYMNPAEASATVKSPSSRLSQPQNSNPWARKQKPWQSTAIQAPVLSTVSVTAGTDVANAALPGPPTDMPTSKASAPAQPKIAFISGPLDIDQAYFETHYVPLLDRAIAEGHSFIVGPSRGTDSRTREYLLARIPASRVTVFVHESEAEQQRRYLRLFERAGGKVVVAGKGHTSRDEAMTRASHYDILRYRTDEECRALYGDKYRKRVSGTEKNELRRKRGVGLVVDAC